MKAKVIVKFKDKETGKVRKVNEIFDCTKKRFEEILTVGKFVEEYKGDDKKETKAE